MSKRTIFLIILLLIVGFIGYPIITSNTNPEDEAIISTPLTSPEVKMILENMSTVSLDASIALSPEFIYLTDITLPLANIPIGKQNPFAPR